MWRLKRQKAKELTGGTPPFECHNALSDALLFPECRHLVHRIRSAQQALDVKSILLLSQLPSEGKTLITSTLAAAAVRLFAQRVLIVDTASASLTDSYSRYHLSPDSAPDLAPLERSKGGIRVIAARSSSGNITPDRQDPQSASTVKTTSAAAASEFEVCAYLGEIRDNYDLILIDGGALRIPDREAPHPSILASYSDAVIVVLSPATIKRQRLTWMKKTLSQHQIKPLGFVFNHGGQV